MELHRARPDWVRRLNQFGPATGDARHVVPLDPDEMLAVARGSTGLHEIGDALFAEYPDAAVVQTHRDPRKFVGSTASTTAMLNWLRSDEVDRPTQGLIALHGFAGMLGLVRELRASGGLPDEQFIDSRYLDLIRDPSGTLREVHARMGLTWPDGHEATIEAYLRDKPKGKFGAHAYRLEDFGLKAGTVDAVMADYVAAYAIESE